MPGALNRFAPLVQLVHHPQALAIYDAAWVVLLMVVIPFAWRLYQAAREIGRRIQWEQQSC